MVSTATRVRPVERIDFPAGGILAIIRSKYKLRILWDLQDGSLRFGQIRKALSARTSDGKEVASRVLSRELKSLVELGLIHRRAYNVIPPRVEYRLTTVGRSFLPVIVKMLEWRTKYAAPRQSAEVMTLVRRGSSTTS
jgi:DNA-binding HxlR family transcriptional regulator